MKKFIIDFFKKFPTCGGLLLLLISCHLTGIKNFTTSWATAPKVFWDIVIIYIIVVYTFIQWFLPNKEKPSSVNPKNSVLTVVKNLTLPPALGNVTDLTESKRKIKNMQHHFAKN